jgi:hypothetical protein
MSSDFDLVERSGRRHRSRRKRLSDYVWFAFAVTAGMVLWAIILWPAMEWVRHGLE